MFIFPLITRKAPNSQFRVLARVPSGLVFLLLAGCGGGGGSTDSGLDVSDVSPLSYVSCTSTGDDSTPNVDGSVSFTQSHTVGSPVYHIVTTRRDMKGIPVTIDYMLHEPVGTPKGIVVLIGGGALSASIQGSEDGGTVTLSGGNFLVRSAHRVAAKGFRAITLDRPSDYREYGDVASNFYLYDTYRNSMDHAVDIATVVERHNNENLPVVFAGTSRGSISAVANNTLATAVALSSVFTRSNVGGSPIGSAALPERRIVRPTLLLAHQQDACWGTWPKGARVLYKTLESAGVPVAGAEVSGGFRDVVIANNCGEFDYHGFTGIENCAMGIAAAQIDDLLKTQALNNPGNKPPVGRDQTVSASGNGNVFTLDALDEEGDLLSFGVPYSKTVLGGEVSILNDGKVNYNAPENITGRQDKFVFTVTDRKGGVGTGIVSVNL